MVSILRIAAFLAVFGLVDAPQAGAQTLGGQLATQKLGQELQGKRARKAAKAKQQAEEALGAKKDEPAEQAAPEGGGEGEGADGSAEAAPAAEPVRLDKWNDQHSIPRSNQPSASWVKLLLMGLMLLFWIRVGDWINRECNNQELGYETWSLVALVPGIIGGALMLLLPFLAGFPLLMACCVGPMIAYTVRHNRAVPAHERVFTPDWFRFVLAEWLGKVGVKVQTEQKAGYLAGAAVEFVAAGDDDRARQANLLTARQSPGYVLVKDMVAEMANRGSNRVMMDYTQQGVSSRQMIDGVWHNGESKDLETGNVMLAVMKQLANLDAKERRSKQQGEFAAEYSKRKYKCVLASQGTKTGERVSITLQGGAEKKFNNYDDIGLRPKLVEAWSAVMAESTGLVVFSSMPENGLTTLMDVSLKETDRLMRDFVAIEEQAKPEAEIENIEQVFFDSRGGETPAKLMPRLIRKYPDVYVVRDLVDDESAKLLLDQVTEGKLLVAGTPARDAAEAVLRVAQRAPIKQIAPTLLASISVKLIRTLCDDCRIEFEPTPDLLKKLGIPAGKVEMLYREPKPEEASKPCKACGGIGFRGRTALFEVLLPDDAVRETLLRSPKTDAVRKAARAAGMRTFQEEGILLVAKGATSLSELQRVLKS